MLIPRMTIPLVVVIADGPFVSFFVVVAAAAVDDSIVDGNTVVGDNVAEGSNYFA